MKNIFELQKFHLNTQRIRYLIPLVFLYLILIFVQYPQMEEMNDTTAVWIFGISQEYLALAEIWFQYLGLRYLTCQGLKESAGFGSMKRWGLWLCSNLFLSILCLLPYGIGLAAFCGSYWKNIPVLFLQCVLIGAFTFFMLCVIGSAAAGMGVMAGYCFLCMTHMIPQKASVLNPEVLPEMFGAEWMINQLLVFVALLFVFILCIRFSGQYRRNR